MNELEQARLVINELDQQMASLFEKRMQVVKQVLNYKKNHHLPILDNTREQELIQKNSAYLNDGTILPYYQAWFNETLSLSKQYQQDLLNQD